MRVGDLVKFPFHISLGVVIERDWQSDTDEVVWRVQWFFPLTSVTSEYKEDLQRV